MPHLIDTFDRVTVINLDRRPERLERFETRLGDWPFRRPERFSAVDGSVVTPPPEWTRGAGAWGCMLSHRQVMRSAVEDGVSSLFVLEDDAVPADDFPRLAADFLDRVPGDWDCLLFGAEHLRLPAAVAPGIVRCISSIRMHAYAVRGRMMSVLLRFWEETRDDHCDLVLSSLLRHFHAYAPDPGLIGQDAGWSDVAERKVGLRFLPFEQTRALADRDVRYSLEKLIVARAAKRPATVA